MVDQKFIEDVMKDYPTYDYEITNLGEEVELKITTKGINKKHPKSRKITKKIHPDEDLSVLRNVLECRES
jgi:hypothetical protein